MVLIGSQFIKIIANRKKKLFRNFLLYFLLPTFLLYILIYHYLLVFNFKSKEEKKYRIFKCFIFVRLFSHQKNQKFTLAHCFHLCHSDEGKFQKIEINNKKHASSCPSSESIPQKAFAACVKSGDTLNVT